MFRVPTNRCNKTNDERRITNKTRQWLASGSVLDDVDQFTMELSVHGKTIRKIFLLADKIHYQDGFQDLQQPEHGTDFDVSLVKGWRDKAANVITYDVETSVSTRKVGDYVVQLQARHLICP